MFVFSAFGGGVRLALNWCTSVTCQSKYDKKEASPHGLASFILFIFFLSSFYFKTTFLPLMMTMPR